MKSLGTTVLLVTLAAVPARATCLSGDDTLSDQRALATIRTQIDTACPCASYTGQPGLARRDYRRCAKPFVDAALDAAVLRKDCRKTALVDVRKTTCGAPDAVACGRVDPRRASSPVGCKTKRAERCHDRSGLQETACGAETHCSDVLTWTAGTCLDGRDPGAAQPGAMHVTYTKPSVVTPAQTRVLPTTIWYPTAATGPIDPATAAVLDAPIDPTGGPFPVVVFSHGNCGFPEQSTFLTALLATRRYVVIAPSHPQSTIFDCAGGTANTVRSAVERPSEAIHVLDQLLAAGQTPGSAFDGLLDETRLAMSGHSFGGFTTYHVATSDPRFAVAVLLAPAVPLTNPVVTIPTLTMFGTDDTFVPLQPIRDRFAAAAPPKYLVEIAHAGHFAFSNGCFPGVPDCVYPETLSQEEAHPVVLRWVVPFLEAHLRGTARLDALLTPPAPPGVTLTAER
jgi:predicted dienelactone hydrolase